AVLGVLLLFTWAINRQVQALAWWAAAFFLVVIAMGLVSFGGSAPTLTILLVANCFVTIAYGVLYSGCRVFNGRAVTLLSVPAGASLWVTAFHFISGD